MRRWTRGGGTFHVEQGECPLRDFYVSPSIDHVFAQDDAGMVTDEMAAEERISGLDLSTLEIQGQSSITAISYPP